jgi:multisubunit Na+/H+ antiporter MnhB subunit
MRRTAGWRLAWGAVAALACLILGLALLRELVGLAEQRAGLTSTVAAALGESGVSHPPTAVLLNFRSYDTWLEVVVLLAAVLGVLSLAERRGLSHLAAPQEVPLLRRLVDLVLPLVILGGVFLLAQGTGAPGGAFQAGAIVAAGLLLAHLAGSLRLDRFPGVMVVLVAGVVAFLVAALATLAAGRFLLDFPTRASYAVIVGIEIGIAVSTALTLAVLVLASAPDADGDRQ